MDKVELASNLVWLLMTVAGLAATRWAVRRGTIRLSMRSALILTGLICMLLLPAISLSDDLLQQHQAALPPSAQTWRVASEDASVNFDLLPLLDLCFLMLAAFTAATCTMKETDWDLRPQSAWLARCLRLRPPPVFVR